MRRKTLVKLITLTWVVAILCLVGIAAIGLNDASVSIYLILSFMILFLFGEYEALLQMDEKRREEEESL